MYGTGVLYIFALIMGACVGSFINVVIHRWPRGMSLVKPGSQCPSCERPIPWYWNLPVISWVLLRGKCRWCGARISARYLVVEVAGGLWAVLMLWRFGPDLSAIAYFIFGAALIAASIIDMEHRLLPDVITVGAIPLGVVIALLPERWAPGWPVTWTESLAGVALGGGIFLVVLLVFRYLTGREGMGWGDVKLMGGIGAFLGYNAIFAVIFFGSATGVITWLLLKAMKKADRDYAIPFGSFLSAAAMAVILARPWLERNWVIIEWGPIFFWNGI